MIEIEKLLATTPKSLEGILAQRKTVKSYRKENKH